jgi:beta-barrel assembly-enhancing protease
MEPLNRPLSDAQERPPRRWRGLLLVLLSSLQLLQAPAVIAADAAAPVSSRALDPVLPALGDAAASEMSVAGERRLGDQIMKEINRDPAWVEDPLLLEYLKGVWLPLLGAARSRGDITDELQAHFTWEPFLVRDRSVNAFALPGGYIGVHLGLIAMTASRDELASVLAHELSHVTQRHLVRMMSAEKTQSMLGAVAMILGLLTVTRSPDAATAVLATGQAAMVQGQLNFSRDMEREADRIGFNVLEKAGFAPAGMTAMFTQLQQANRLNDNQQFPYLRSHPLTAERIGEAQARLGVGATRQPSTSGQAAALWLHAVMRARARALMDLRVETQRRLVAGLGDGSLTSAQDQLGAAVSAAIAATRLRDWATAGKAIDRANALVRSADPSETAGLHQAMLHLQAEYLLERGKGPEAADLMLRERDTGSRADMLLTARCVQTLNGRPSEFDAISDKLRVWLTVSAHDAGAWSALGQIQERQRLPVSAARAFAEAQFARGDLNGAIDRLRAAKALAQRERFSDGVEAAVIESRLKALEYRRRLDMEEAQANGGRR